MTVVQGTALDSAKTPIPYAQIQITLVTGTPGGPGYTSLGELYGTHEIAADNKGAWSIDLTPTTQITPANTYYQVQEGVALSIIQVPASGGPYEISTLLVTPPPTPAAPGITGVQVAVAGTLDGNRPEINFIPGPNVAIGAVDNPGAGRVDVTITAASGSGIPATTVQSGTAFGVASAVGTDTSYAREDHQHGTPSLGAVTALTAFGTGSSNGTAGTASHSDHVHGAPALPTATTSAAGIVELDGTATDIQALGTQAAGAVGKAADAGHVHPTSGLVLTSQLGANSGVATLDSSGHLVGSQAANLISSGICDMYGLGLCTVERLTDSGYSSAQSAGDFVLFLVNAPKTATISTLGIQVTVAGVTGSGVNGMALYTEAGVLIDQTGDMTAAISSIQFAEGAMGSSHTVIAGTNYWLSVLTHFSGGAPRFAATGTTQSSNIPILNGHYTSIYHSGIASFPGSFTPSAYTLNSGNYVAYAR